MAGECKSAREWFWYGIHKLIPKQLFHSLLVIYKLQVSYVRPWGSVVRCRSKGSVPNGEPRETIKVICVYITGIRLLNVAL